MNYQITTPSTMKASPTDPFGNLGPYEQAIVDTPILESVPDDQIKGIDVLRAIRSFDPCMPCTTHMDTARASSPGRSTPATARWRGESGARRRRGGLWQVPPTPGGAPWRESVWSSMLV